MLKSRYCHSRESGNPAFSIRCGTEHDVKYKKVCLLIRAENILHFNLMNYAQIPVLSFPRKRESSLFYQMWN